MITAAAQTTSTFSAGAPANSAPAQAAGFADLLSATTQTTPTQGPIVSGRVGMTLTPSGTPSTIVYYAADGSELTRSPMIPSRMLQLMDQFAISKSDLAGLATQLDKAGVKYKPGELASGVAGLGVNLHDLAAGGLGTTFDWTQDANVALKGPQAAADLATFQQLAARLGVHGRSVVGADLPDVTAPVTTPVSSGPSIGASPTPSSVGALTDQGAIKSGRMGMTLTPTGTPSTIVYYGADGSELTRSPMIPSRMLQLMDQFGIPKSDLNGLAAQLDEAGVRYKPGELAPGITGLGVNLHDLAAGGLGTIFDWTQDANVALKGPQAAADLAASQQLAARLGVHGLSVLGANLAYASSDPTAPGAAAPAAKVVPLIAVTTSPGSSVVELAATASSLGSQFEQLDASSWLAAPTSTAAASHKAASAPTIAAGDAASSASTAATPPAAEAATPADLRAEGGLSAISYSLNALLMAQLAQQAHAPSGS